MNSLVWIAKLYRAHVTQYHLQLIWQTDDIIPKMLAGNGVAPVGVFQAWPFDEDMSWLDVGMHDPVCMEVCAGMKKTCHHMPALHL